MLLFPSGNLSNTSILYYYEQLSKKGTLRIIDYTETSGSGKIQGTKKTRSKTSGK
jgi:hypothetical protein